MSDDGKVTIFVTSGPATPQRCATPFYMASVAAAMDNEAEMIFQIDGVLLMKKALRMICLPRKAASLLWTSFVMQKKQMWR